MPLVRGDPKTIELHRAMVALTKRMKSEEKVLKEFAKSLWIESEFVAYKDKVKSLREQKKEEKHEYELKRLAMFMREAKTKFIQRVVLLHFNDKIQDAKNNSNIDWLDNKTP